MSFDAANSEPMALRPKVWMIMLAVVVAALTIAFFLTQPKPEPVKVWFVRTTNLLDMGRLVLQKDGSIPLIPPQPGTHKALLFKGTNATLREIQFAAELFMGAMGQAKAPIGFQRHYSHTFANVAAGTNFNFTLLPPPEDVSYYVVWQFNEKRRPPTRSEKFRIACYNFFRAYEMPSLAEGFWPTPTPHIILSSAIKE